VRKARRGGRTGRQFRMSRGEDVIDTQAAAALGGGGSIADGGSVVSVDTAVLFGPPVQTPRDGQDGPSQAAGMYAGEAAPRAAGVLRQASHSGPLNGAGRQRRLSGGSELPPTAQRAHTLMQPGMHGSSAGKGASGAGSRLQQLLPASQESFATADQEGDHGGSIDITDSMSVGAHPSLHAQAGGGLTSHAAPNPGETEASRTLGPKHGRQLAPIAGQGVSGGATASAIGLPPRSPIGTQKRFVPR
jgi:hypothetical protein